jgi:hypothetical protein
MLRPVGNLPPAVYWRRRFVLAGALVALVLLLVLTVKAFGSGRGSPAAAADTSSRNAPSPGASAATQPHRTSPATSASASRPVGSSAAAPSGSASSPAAPGPCTPAQLSVAALVEHPSYHVGQEPVVMLQVTDTGAAPCVQDFGQNKVELRVYNGESRVWGSNDCSAKSGPLPRTLLPHQPVRVRITWSGLSSQPACKGTRQRAGAGTYTLYASLGAKAGSAAQFAIA